MKKTKKIESRNPELTLFMRTLRGGRSIDAIAKEVESSSYWRWETDGRLPTKYNGGMLARLAQVLGTTPETLVGFVRKKEIAERNLRPLLEAMFEAHVEIILLEDIQYLLRLQKAIRLPINSKIVQVLLEARRASPGSSG